MVIWLLACTGGGETGGDGVADSAIDSGVDADAEPVGALPQTVEHIGLMAGSVGWFSGAAAPYTVDGGQVQPSMTFGFFSTAFILGLDDAAWCQGTVALDLTEVPSSEAHWLTFSADLALLESDCTADWADGDPAVMLDGQHLTIGIERYEPLDEPDFADALKDVEGFVYLVQLIDAEPFDLGYGTLAAAAGDELIVADGQVQLLPVGSPFPSGILRWHALHSFDIAILNQHLSR